MRINEIKACQMYSDTISETLIWYIDVEILIKIIKSILPNKVMTYVKQI
jgi:hypothetical protein